MKQGEGETVFRAGPLPEGLHVVSTPIGAARDITLRALDVLASADVLAAEDTRVLRRLMEIHGVPLAGRPLVPYHDHNGAAQRPVLLAHLAGGARVAYASDAGTPLVADPGFALVRDAAAAGHAVHAVPGASALLAGLITAGLPSDRFLFAGFPPAKAAARRKWLGEIAEVKATLVLYEAGRRIGALLADLSAIGQGARDAVLCRELTKRFEEAQRGHVDDLAARYADGVPKGEIVLVLGPPPAREADDGDVKTALRDALAEAPLRQAAARVAAQFGVSKRSVYQLGLSLEPVEPRENGDDPHHRN